MPPAWKGLFFYNLERVRFLTLHPQLCQNIAHVASWQGHSWGYYRKRGSASYIVREVQSVRERERESETEVVRRKWRHHCRAKIGDNLHFPLPKIRTYRFPLHTSRLSLHGEVTRDGSDVTIVALKLAINLHFPLPKIALIVSPFTLPVSPFTERSPLWNIEKLDQINTKNYWK